MCFKAATARLGRCRFLEKRGDKYLEDQDKLQDELQEEINGEDLEEQQEEKAHRERICYICRRPESKAGPMLDMPG